MSKIKKIVILITCLIAFYIISTNTYALNPVDISGESAILMDAGSGEVLYEKNIHSKVYPASTTKILTAILVIENLPFDSEIKVPDNFEYVDGSSLYLVPGETFTVKELLEAMLIHSCNDVSVLFAKEISGDIVSFSNLMNEKAKEIGCLESNFTNPHGLHDVNHYTTSYDMALISRAAMNNFEFKRIVSIPFLEMRASEQYGEKRYLQNTNRFLWSDSEIIYNNEYIPIKYDIVDGIKTGYTEEAGNCLMSSAQLNNMRLISGVFKSNGFDVYRDSRLLLDYGFENYESFSFLKEGTILGEVDVARTAQKKLSYGIPKDFYLVVKKGQKPELKWEFIPDEISLPIYKGDKIGTIKIINDGKDYKFYDAVALNDLESIFTFKYFKEIFNEKKDSILSFRTFLLLIIILIATLLLRILYVHIKRRNRRKRYKGL